MKKIILSALTLLAFLSCTKRTVIPDAELSLIFRDAFLVNAYIFDSKTNFDTLQVYQPIFDRYGYSVEDVAYTVGSFSKRKSARLSDVVERSISLLEQQESYYRAESVILDSIDKKALRAAKQQFFYRDRVEFYSMQDTVDLRIELLDLPAGEYNISFGYQVDSLDNNTSNYRTMSWVELPDSTSTRKGVSTSYLRKRTNETFKRKIDFDTATSKFVIMLAESFEAKRTPHITFQDVTVDYTPNVEVAVDQLFKNKLKIRIFADDFFDTPTTDSLQLPSL